MIKNNRIDRLAIDEGEERLNRFFEIFLRVDLRTIERLENKTHALIAQLGQIIVGKIFGVLAFKLIQSPTGAVQET